MSVFGVFLVRISPHLSVFSSNAGKYRPGKFRIWTLFTQCLTRLTHFFPMFPLTLCKHCVIWEKNYDKDSEHATRIISIQYNLGYYISIYLLFSELVSVVGNVLLPTGSHTVDSYLTIGQANVL